MLETLDDANVWLRRADQHIEEFRRLRDFRHNPLWRIEIAQRADGTFVYRLIYNRELAPRLKVIAAEAASALFQVLDHVFAVGARLSGIARKPGVSWPFVVKDEMDNSAADAVGALPRLVPDIGDKLAEFQKKGLRDEWLNLIRETFEENLPRLAMASNIKEVSLSGKHWELIPTADGAAAVTWTDPVTHRQQIYQIPRNAFDLSNEYVLHAGERLPTESFSIVMFIHFVGENIRGRSDPLEALNHTRGFVTVALEKASGVITTIGAHT